MWYAFDAGSARFYVLTAAWSDGNVGTASVYQDDRDAHWTASSAEYQWLQADLAAHPNALKFAFWHYPLYADSGGQPSDTFLQGGAGTLQGLLDQYSVAVAFNGHAHGYERNKPDSAGLVSYVLGNAGAAMGSVSGCSTFDAYALGSGGSHCGAAPAGQSVDHVYGFAKVTVNGSQVTVTPTDELGRTFDVQTYTFSTAPPDTIKPTPPTTVTATAVSTGKVALSWSGATDNVAVTGYRISRDGIQIAEQPGSATSYTDSTVAPNTTYSYTIVAIDAAANVSPPSTPVSVSTTGATDGTPPSAPTGLVASAPSSSQVNLSWTASTDNVAVAGYNVYRNGTLLQAAALSDATPPTTYTDDTAAPGSAYTYEVSAVDAAGNESTRSSVMITTPGGGGGTLTFAPVGDATVDNSQPTTSFGLTSRLTVDNSPVNDALLKFTVTGTAGCAVSKATLTLTVGSTTNDNSAYGGDAYGTSDAWTEGAVTWNSAPAATTAKLSSVPTAVSLNTAYQFDVTPLVTGDGNVNVLLASINSDGARYFSRESSTAQAPQLKVTCAGDTTPPAPPGNLTATALSGTQVSLSWTASPDPDVAAYKVFRNGSATALATLPASAGGYVDNTAVAGTTYTYQVSALDTAGNQSTRASVSVTTPTSSDFSITANPNSATVTAGNAVTSTIVTAVTSGSPQTLTLSATGLPSGASASFAPATINAGQSSTMTITTGGSTPAGSSTVQVTATAGAAAHSTTVALTVTAAQSNDFAMSVSPASLTIAAGQAGTATVTTAVASGSAEAITLSCAGQPSGVSVTLAPTSVTAGASSTMTVSVGSGVTPGTYPLTVTGTSVSATHIAPVTLSVGSSVVPRFVQSAAGTASATTTALAATFGAPTGAGNLLVATAGVYTGATNHLTSVTDSAGNTWNRIGAYSASGHNSDGELWYSAGAASVTSVTVHTAAAASIVLTVQEFSGVATASSLDTSSGTSNTSTAPSSGTIVPGSANELIVGFLSGHGNSEALTLTTPGYTALPQATTSITGSVVTVRTGYQVVSSNSAIGIAGSFPTAMYWAAGVAGFRAGP
jgi:fibronectin type 3 domain-containing protein